MTQHIFFTSDTHYFHRNIQKYCSETRPQGTVEEMNEFLIAAHNSRVKKNDVIYFLGDFAFTNAENTKELINRLNGKKHMILGNHDAVIRKNKDIQEMFESVQNLKEISIDKQKIVLCHFSMRIWNGMHWSGGSSKPAWHLYGHSHGSLEYAPYGKSMDVGVDARPQKDCAPWALEEISAIMRERPVLVVDHHGNGE